MTVPAQQSGLGDLQVSVVRTMTPVVVGALIGRFADQDDAAVVAPVATVLYYLVARLLERTSGSFGWLLGYAKPPVYGAGAATSPRPLAAAVSSSRGEVLLDGRTLRGLTSLQWEEQPDGHRRLTLVLVDPDVDVVLARSPRP